MVFVNLLYKHELKIYVSEIELKCLPQRNVSKEKYDWNRTVFIFRESNISIDVNEVLRNE